MKKSSPTKRKVEIASHEIRRITIVDLKTLKLAYIYLILRLSEYNRSLAATRLNMSVRGLRNKVEELKNLGIDIPSGDEFKKGNDNA